jgi:hypothetical protein
MICQDADCPPQDELQIENYICTSLDEGNGFRICDGASDYVPRDPTDSVLYTAVAENLETFLARQRQGERLVPQFVERECASSWSAAFWGEDSCACTPTPAAGTASWLFPVKVAGSVRPVAGGGWRTLRLTSLTGFFRMSRSDNGSFRSPSLSATVWLMIRTWCGL